MNRRAVNICGEGGPGMRLRSNGRDEDGRSRDGGARPRRRPSAGPGLRLRRGRALLPVAAAVAVFLLAGACTGGGSDGSDQATSQASTSTSTTPEEAAVEAAASASPGSTLTETLPELAARETQLKGFPLRLAVNDLSVSGSSTRLMLTLTNTRSAQEDTTSTFQLGTNFSDGVRDGNSPLTQDSLSIDGIYLLDLTGAKRYLPGRNAEQGCVCTGDTASILLKSGDSVVLSSVFAALPDDVSTVDVVVPKFGTFGDVSVSR